MSDFSDYDDLTWFATIVGAHGIKGAVRVKFFTETPEYYLSVKLFFLENARQLLPMRKMMQKLLKVSNPGKAMRMMQDMMPN